MSKSTSQRVPLTAISRNPSKAPTAASGQKRAFDQTESDEPEEDLSLDGWPIDKNCDQVRRQIRTYLASGEKKGEFCRALGVSDKSVNGFLAQHGPMKGAGSDAYGSAWEFFKKRELAGKKMPKKQKTNTPADKKAAETIKEAGNTAGIDISGITIVEEENDNVPIFDSCDEVRRKIKQHMKKPGVTQAAFCRDLSAQLHTPGASQCQSGPFKRFCEYNGPTQGNASSIYYAAYVFFEKLRIKNGEKPTEHRKGMEKAWPHGMERRQGRVG